MVKQWDRRTKKYVSVQTLNEVKPVRTYGLGFVILAIILGGFAGWWLNPARAYGERPIAKDCTDWTMSNRDADLCRNEGWTVRYHDARGEWALIVTPRGVLSETDLKSCHYEDGSGGPRPCVWFGQEDGNGHGLTYWVSRNMRAHYMWPYSPTTNGWEWVSRDDAQAMASTGHRTTAWWRSCVTRVVNMPDGKVRQVKCRNGYRYSDAA